MNSKFEEALLVEYKKGLWIQCPYCKKLIFPVDKETGIQNLRYYCKNSRCKRTMLINVEPIEPIDQ